MAGPGTLPDLVQIGLYVGCQSSVSPTRTDAGDRFGGPSSMQTVST